MSAKRIVATTLSVAILLSAASAGAAYEAYLKIKGTKQGQFKATSPRSPSQPSESIAIVDFDYGVIAPRDAASGLPTGKRMHKPITVRREVDAASPLLLQALSTNEALVSCVLSESETGVQGGTVTATLTNAHITAHAVLLPDATHPELDKTRKYETLSISFDRMDIVHSPSGKTESLPY